MTQDLHLSRFRFFSVGIAAQNKAATERNLEVFPVETIPFADGEITDNLSESQVDGKKSDGTAFTDKVKTTASLKAQWLRFGHDNRLTAPDVRRGEWIMLYQFGDTDKYYWMTLQDDSKLRRLETVIYGWSGSSVEGDPVDHDHMYYLEVSTHKGLVSFHTSKVNGEFCTYDVQINTKDGAVTIQDDLGNVIFMDSAQHRLYMKNTDESFFDMDKKVLTISTPTQINLKSTAINITASDGVSVQGDSSIDLSTSAMSTKSSGAMKIQAGGSASFTSGASITIASPATAIS